MTRGCDNAHTASGLRFRTMTRRATTWWRPSVTQRRNVGIVYSTRVSLRTHSGDHRMDGRLRRRGVFQYRARSGAHSKRADADASQSFRLAYPRPNRDANADVDTGANPDCDGDILTRAD